MVKTTGSLVGVIVDGSTGVGGKDPLPNPLPAAVRWSPDSPVSIPEPGLFSGQNNVENEVSDGDGGDGGGTGGGADVKIAGSGCCCGDGGGGGTGGGASLNSRNCDDSPCLLGMPLAC